MAFSSVMTFICVGYVLAYGGMVIYDLFFAKEPIELAPKVDEEEIDISDEAKTFNPVVIDKDGRFHWEQDNIQNEDNGVNQAEGESEEQPEEQSEETGSPHETVSASEIEASAREQAQSWMYAQAIDIVDTEVEKETTTMVDVVSDEVGQSEGQTDSLSPTEAEPQEISTSSEIPLDTPSTSVAADSQQDHIQDEEPLIMTGAIEMSELTGMLDELAEKGKDSPLGRIIQFWNVDAA